MRHERSKYWSVVKSEPQREALALQHLRTQDVECYCPQIYNDRIKRREALFPSYLFVLLVRDESWAHINNTRGVSYLIVMQGKPCPVPTKAIKAIRAAENANGVIVLPEQQELKTNDPLLITDGPFKGHGATFLRSPGHKRVELLLTFLGTQQRVTLPRSSVSRQ